MSTATYVCLFLLGMTLNIAGAVAVAIFKRKGVDTVRNRPIQIKVYMNEKEYENLCNLCEETNLKKGRLIRLLLEGYVPPPAPPVEYNKLIREVRAVGNNINQILFFVRANGILNVPDLKVELKKLREVEKEIRDGFKIRKY